MSGSSNRSDRHLRDQRQRQPAVAALGQSRTVRVAALARVEGEGALHLALRDGQIQEARLDIYEPPRFFEAFLRGRDFREVPDITARICGICPVAYQMSACHALEQAIGIDDRIDPQVRALRNLLYCGEWIESHVLHMFLLHLPDFLGYESAISMAADHGPVVREALQLKKVGNQIVALLGGRAVHPVGACVGGFHAAPDAQQAAALLPQVRRALEQMCELTLFLAAKVRYPRFERDYEFVALQPPDEYPMNLGPIASSRGLRVEQEDFLEVVEERQVPHSTALHAVTRGRGAAYHVGPLARLNLNAPRLHSRAADLLPQVCRAIGCDLPWRNPFLSLAARALETVHALALAADLLADYRLPAASRVAAAPCAGSGAAATEAPRGILWHQYRLEADGTVAAARIIPPTAQNQLQIEEDLRSFAQQMLGGDSDGASAASAAAASDLTDEQLALRCEHMIRNYDPCISCSVHFLKVRRDRL